MDLLGRIKCSAAELFTTFKETPELALIIGCIFACVTLLCIRSIVNALYAMHRSNSMLKKLRREYTFGQKLIMIPAWKNCLHASQFCRALIVLHHVRLMFLLSTLLIALFSCFFSMLVSVYALLSWVIFVILDIPILLLHRVMDRYPLQRHKNGYRFQKYHNTKNHDSLF